MTVYRPHGYIDYNDFFHRILDVLLKDNSEKETFAPGNLLTTISKNSALESHF